MSYDGKCLELAKHFLDETDDEHVHSEFAQDIQDYVETWLDGRAATLQRQRQ